MMERVVLGEEAMRAHEMKSAYYERRADAEYAAAEAAAHDRARDLHRELAGLYRAHAQTLAETPAI